MYKKGTIGREKMMITTLFFALERRLVFEYEESEKDVLVFYGKKGQLTETVKPLFVSC